MSKKMVALTAVLVFLLSGAAVFGFLMWKHKDEATGSPVAFTVVAEGWDAETSSPIPVHITGETVNNKKVDEKYFIGKSDKELRLKPGTYTAEIYASPVNGDGGMYRASEPVEIVIPDNTDKTEAQPTPSASSETSVSPDASPSPEVSPSADASASADTSNALVVTAEINLAPIPADEITDEDIEKAQAAMKEAGLDDEEIATFADSAHLAKEVWPLLAGEYSFSSGAGAWGTSMSIKADGTFSGSYYDANMGAYGCSECTAGELYTSNFTGRFSNVKKISDLEYRATIETIELERPAGTQEVVTLEGGYKRLDIYSEPYGMTDKDGKAAVGKEMTFYLPGMRVSDFSPDCVDEYGQNTIEMWVPTWDDSVRNGDVMQKKLAFVTETCSAFVGG